MYGEFQHLLLDNEFALYEASFISGHLDTWDVWLSYI